MSLDSPKIPIAPVYLAPNTNLFTIRRYTHTNFHNLPLFYGHRSLWLSTELICGYDHGVRTNRLDHRLLPTEKNNALNECSQNVLARGTL